MEPPIVVIGSGPSGAAAALALGSKGYPVTVMESGVRPIRAFRVQVNGASLYRWAPEASSPLPWVAAGDPQTLWYHELALGGLSNYWTGAVPRFAPDDFSDGVRVSEEFDWPIRYQDVEPYYRWAERLMRVSGSSSDAPGLPAGRRRYPTAVPGRWQRFAEVASGRGQGVVPIPLASGRRWSVSGTAEPFTSSAALCSAAGKRGSPVRILSGAHATHLLVNASGDVDGVEYFSRTRQEFERLGCSGVVVAAGAIATPKLLLDSTSNVHLDGLGNAEGLVGRYLQDHTRDWAIIRLARGMPKLRHPLYLTRSPHFQSEPMSGVSYTFSARTNERDRYSVHLPGVSTRFAFSAFGMQQPEASNRVGLHESRKDDFGLPVPTIDARFDSSAYRHLENARLRLLELLEAAGLQPELLTATSDSPPGGAVHWSGSVRMHNSPRFGPCDSEGRLWGASNVAIADASVFTTPVEKNPTLTSMALAARASLALARDLRSGL